VGGQEVEKLKKVFFCEKLALENQVFHPLQLEQCSESFNWNRVLNLSFQWNSIPNSIKGTAYFIEICGQDYVV
jgi:hypothetical protein